MRHGFIWYVIITAIQRGLDPALINYKVTNRSSPLVEYAPSLFGNSERPEPDEAELAAVDVNPFWRLGFSDIFDKILIPGRDEPNAGVVCDLMVHALADADRFSHMCRRDFQILLVMRDIESGLFGGGGQAKLFSVFETRALAEALIALYRTGDSLSCLTWLFTMIMTDTSVSDRDLAELIIYNPSPYTERGDGKLRFIAGLFVPASYEVSIHWQYTYGVIGQDDSMALEHFIL